MSHKMKKQSGFTLIEIMIVIIIISIISYYAITLLRDKAESQAINRTLIEFKNWQEVVLSYYAANKRWPLSLDALWNTSTQLYFEQSAQCSPWPGKQTTNNACPNNEIYTGEQFVSYYTISLKVPNSAIAKQIAGKLPQALAVDDVVKSSVAIPGYYRGGITSAGIINTGQKIYMPKCPEGYEGHYIVSPQYLSMGFQKFGWECGGGDCVGVNIEMGYDSTVKYRGGQPYIYAYTHVHSPDSDHFYYAYFMTFCLPSGTWFPLKANNSLVQLMGKEVFQCSSTWTNYNYPFGKPC